MLAGVAGFGFVIVLRVRLAGVAGFGFVIVLTARLARAAGFIGLLCFLFAACTAGNGTT